MSTAAVALTVVAAALTAALIGMLIWATAVGNFYRRTNRRQLEQILNPGTPAVLYHYMSARDFDQAVDVTTGTAIWRRGKRNLNLYYLRAVYFYVGHHPTGARSNHPRKRRRDGAVVAVDAGPVLATTAHVRPWFRRWDHALAVPTDVTLPIVGYLRGIDILATKTDPTPPQLISAEPPAD